MIPPRYIALAPDGDTNVVEVRRPIFEMAQAMERQLHSSGSQCDSCGQTRVVAEAPFWWRMKSRAELQTNLDEKIAAFTSMLTSFRWPGTIQQAQALRAAGVDVANAVMMLLDQL